MNAEGARVAWWREPTRGQWFSFTAAWAGWVLDAFDFTVFFLAMPYIAKEFGVSDAATAGSITLTLLMRLLGGMVAGSMADKLGRKLPLMISIVWFALCDGAVAFAPTFGWILALRTIFGFGMGAEWTSGATLAMENWPARSRGIASGVLQGSWAIGYLLAAQVFAVVMPIWGWRALFVIAALPVLLVLPIRIWVPESPEWQKQVTEQPKTSMRELAAPSVLRNMVWASVILAFGFGAYYSLSGLYPTMLKKEMSFEPTAIANLVALFNVGMMIGAIACGWLAARRGVIIAVMVPALLMMPFLPLYVGKFGSLHLGAFVGGMFGVGFSGVTPALLADLFPARIRARASGIVYHVGACFAAFIPPIVAALPAWADLSLAASIAIVAGLCELTLVVALLFKPRAQVAPAAAVESQTPAGPMVAANHH